MYVSQDCDERLHVGSSLGGDSVVNLKLWNALPFDIRSASTVSIFKAKHKTHLFRHALSCACEHVWNLPIINGLLLLLLSSLVTQETAGRVTLFEQLHATEKFAFPNDQLCQQCFGSKMAFCIFQYQNYITVEKKPLQETKNYKTFKLVGFYTSQLFTKV